MSRLLAKFGVGAGVLLFIFVLWITLFMVRVPEGQVAVIYTPNGGVTKTVDAGWKPIAPLDKATLYPTRITVVNTKLTVTTKDGKAITVPAKYEMKVDPTKIIDIYKTLGSQDILTIQENYLQQRLFKEARNVVSDYTVLEIYGADAQTAQADITKQFSESVADMGFIIDNVTLGTIELDEATETSIAARVKASQENELKKTELENDKIEADRKRVQAQGEADAMLIKAEGEAKANRILSESLTEQILRSEEIEARKIHGWKTHIFGESPTPVTEAGK